MLLVLMINYVFFIKVIVVTTSVSKRNIINATSGENNPRINIFGVLQTLIFASIKFYLREMSRIFVSYVNHTTPIDLKFS